MSNNLSVTGRTFPDVHDPVTRIARLFDHGSYVSLHDPDDSGVLAALGRIDGRIATAFCTDARLMGGSLTLDGCAHIVEAIDTAVRECCPVIGLWHSGGARLAEGVTSLDGVGRVFAAMTRASGRVPQLSVVVGPAAGGAAYGPALTDVVIMSGAARVFVTGPDVVRTVTGEEVDMAGLGGPDTHTRRSGVAHIATESEDDAVAAARRVAGLLNDPGRPTTPLDGPGDLRALLPESPRRAYDVHPLVRAILDPAEADGAFTELQRGWAPNIVVGLGRLGGGTVGVIASNPLRKGGCLDSLSAEKAARFVRMCDAFGVPLVVIVDVPGFLPGVGQEWDGVVRRGAKLLHAFAEAGVARVTLITRKAYGGAYLAMNSRSLGATAVFAWPDAEVAVMGAEAAVGVLYRRSLAAASDGEREALRARLAEEHRLKTGGVERALDLGLVDEVIDPAKTRLRLADALAAAVPRRGSHGNIPL